MGTGSGSREEGFRSVGPGGCNEDTPRFAEDVTNAGEADDKTGALEYPVG